MEYEKLRFRLSADPLAVELRCGGVGVSVCNNIVQRMRVSWSTRNMFEVGRVYVCPWLVVKKWWFGRMVLHEYAFSGAVN
jgi:hypothetical protein